MCTRAEFSELVKAMKCIYTMPSFLPDLESISVWYVVLQHFSYADLKKAFASYYPLNSFPPTPADLIKLLIRPSNKTGIGAWSEVLRAISRHGPGDSVKASDCVDDLTNKVIKGMGGWEVIRNCSTDNLGFLMKQFVSAYDDNIQQETINSLPEAMRQTMIGSDSQNLLEGNRI